MAEWMDISEMAPEQPEKRIHMERYEYAASVLAGKRVLDCACGMGYGTAILSITCDATGVDIDPAAILRAMDKYPERKFCIADFNLLEIGGFLQNFDALVSFETLEHLEDPALLIGRLPDNIVELVVSAPIRPTVGWNPWHKTDFTHGSLCTMIEQAGFRIVYVKSQQWVDGKGDLYLMVHARRGNWTL
jgi:SAM-dependent methyltransferase